MTIEQLSNKINIYMGRNVPYEIADDVPNAYTFGDHVIGTYIYAYESRFVNLDVNSFEARSFILDITSFLEQHNV